MPDSTYSCVLLPVEGSLRKEVLELASKVPDDVLAEKGRESDPHITLLPDLKDEYPSHVADVLSRFQRPVRFALGPVTVFENDEHDVLKVSAAGPDLYFLNALLRANCTHDVTHPAYQPHVTLAYVKKGKGPELARQLGRLDRTGQSDVVVFSDPDRKHTPIRLVPTVDNPVRYSFLDKKLFLLNDEGKRFAVRLLNRHPSIRAWKASTYFARHSPATGKVIWNRDNSKAPDVIYENEHDARQDHPDILTPKRPQDLEGMDVTPESMSMLGITPPDFSDHIDRLIEGAKEKSGRLSDIDIYSPTDHLTHDELADDQWNIDTVKKRPRGVRYLHSLSAVLTGKRPAAVVPNSFLHEHPVGTALMQRLTAEGHVVEPTGAFGGNLSIAGRPDAVKDAGEALAADNQPAFHKAIGHTKYATDESPARYEIEQTVTHADIAGFKLESVLKHLSDDPSFTDAGRQMAKKVLTDGDVSALWPLNDELQDAGHPLADRYNWLRAVHSIHLDRAVGHALDAVSGGGSVRTEMRHPAIHQMRSVLNRTGSRLPTNPKALEAVSLLTGQGHSKDDLLKSLARHEQRASRQLHKRSGRLDQTQQDEWALDPQPDDPERYQTADMGDYDPLPSPSTKTAPIPKKVAPYQRLMALIAAAKAKQKQVKSTFDGNYDYDPLPTPIPKPKVQAPASGYDTVSRQPKPAAEMYRLRDELPVRYRQSPALSDFIQAVRQVRSSNQEARRQLAEAQFKKLKLDPEAVRDAISDAPHTASADIASALLHDGDLERVRAAASLYGLANNSPSLMLFHEDEAGPDRLWKVGVSGSGEKFRKRLDEAGLAHRTLLPTSSGWDAVLVSPNGSLDDRIAQFAQSVGSQPEVSRGHHELIGDSLEAEGDESTRQTYRSLIRKFERSQQNADLSENTSVNDSHPDQLARSAPAATGQPAFSGAPAAVR